MRLFRTPRRRRFDGRYEARQDKFTDAYGTVVRQVHRADQCAGRPCAIHSLTDHPMREFPLSWRQSGMGDIKPPHFERICPHGIGHPDPDDMTYWASHGMESMAVHGCDGCCG